MVFDGSTPKEAIERMKKYYTNAGLDMSGLFYATEHMQRHPNRRFSSAYIKNDVEAGGTGEERTKAICTLTDDGYYLYPCLQ